MRTEETVAGQAPVRLKPALPHSDEVPGPVKAQKQAPGFRRQVSTIVCFCERSSGTVSSEYTEQIHCIIKRIKLSMRFWDHLSEKHSICLSQSEAINMARADVEIEMAKLKRKAESLSKRRAWMWFWPSKVLKKWIFLMQTVSQIELSFQGLCRQIIQEDDVNIAFLKQQQTGPPLVVKRMGPSEDGSSAVSGNTSPDPPDTIAACFPESYPPEPPEITKELEVFLFPATTESRVADRVDSPVSTGSTDLQSQGSHQVGKQQSNALTVSVASPGSPDSAWPTFLKMYHPNGVLCSKEGNGDTKQASGLQTELPISSYCAMQRSFSGSASPASVPSPKGGNSWALGARAQGGPGNSNRRGTAALSGCAPDSTMLGTREYCATSEGADCGSPNYSEAPELSRVQTTVYDAAGKGRPDLEPLRILRDFEARTFGPPPPLHNLLPIAGPTSVTSSPRSLPQSPLGASKPCSAAALGTQQSRGIPQPDFRPKHCCRTSKMPTAPSDLSTYSNAHSTGPYSTATAIAPNTSQLYGAFSFTEQLTARSHAPTVHSPTHHAQQLVPALDMHAGLTQAGPPHRDADFHPSPYPCSAPASLDATQLRNIHPSPFTSHMHCYGHSHVFSAASDFAACAGGSPRSMLSATQSMPSMEQQAHDIDRLSELEAAAALGSAKAQYEIACMVLEGRGVPPDVRFATAWFGCAASPS